MQVITSNQLFQGGVWKQWIQNGPGRQKPACHYPALWASWLLWLSFLLISSIVKCGVWARVMFPRYKFTEQPYLGHLGELPKLYSWIHEGVSPKILYFFKSHKRRDVWNTIMFLSPHVLSVKQWFNEVNSMKKNLGRNSQSHIFRRVKTAWSTVF